MTSALLRALLIFLIPFYQSTQPCNNCYIYMFIIINGDNPNKRFELCSQKQSSFWATILDKTCRTHIPPISTTMTPPPTLISQGKKWSRETSILLFWGEGGVFVIITANALKGIILKLDMATSIFGSIVIQDCCWILRKSFPLYLFTTMLFN